MKYIVAFYDDIEDEIRIAEKFDTEKGAKALYYHLKCFEHGPELMLLQVIERERVDEE